ESIWKQIDTPAEAGNQTVRVPPCAQGIVLFGSVLDLHVPFFVKFYVLNWYSRAAWTDQVAEFDIDVSKLGIAHPLNYNLESRDLIPGCLEGYDLFCAIPDEVPLAVVAFQTISKKQWIHFEGFIGERIDSNIVPNRPNPHGCR